MTIWDTEEYESLLPHNTSGGCKVNSYLLKHTVSWITDNSTKARHPSTIPKMHAWKQAMGVTGCVHIRIYSLSPMLVLHTFLCCCSADVQPRSAIPSNVNLDHPSRFQQARDKGMPVQTTYSVRRSISEWFGWTHCKSMLARDSVLTCFIFQVTHILGHIQPRTWHFPCEPCQVLPGL